VWLKSRNLRFLHSQFFIFKNYFIMILKSGPSCGEHFCFEIENISHLIYNSCSSAVKEIRKSFNVKSVKKDCVTMTLNNHILAKQLQGHTYIANSSFFSHGLAKEPLPGSEVTRFTLAHLHREVKIV